MIGLSAAASLAGAPRQGVHLQYGTIRLDLCRHAARRPSPAPFSQLPRDPFMKLIAWVIRVLVFVLLLVLALSNTQPATLSFLAGYAWQAPLILIGLAFFVVGLLAGLLSALPALFKLRMENGRLKRDLRTARETPAPVAEPPLPPLI
ncbi:lipopolysaccharide assembly protein LapA domain-containing protein [Paraburkholderia denitrificans]|uniref:Lipopolysaccharide assembly protein LapA domain-containing protein n=2 Tax=Paraburkholderia TaxID=1822464 RepID=A0ABW0J651_9BURK